MALTKQTDGNVLYASELDGNESFTLSRLLEYAIDGATITNQSNLIHLDSSDFDSANSTAYLSYDIVVFQEQYDDYAGTYSESWTGAGGSYSSGTVAAQSTNASAALATSDGTVSSFDLKTADGATKFCLRVYANTGTVGVKLSDGANKVTLYTVSGASPETNRYYYIEIVTDVSEETCNVWIDGVQTQTDLDLSVLSNYYIEAYATSGNPGIARIFLYPFGKVDLSTTYTATFDNSTISGISFIKKTYPINGANCFYSVDDGSNYSALTNGVLTGVTFTELKMQETKLVSSITVDTENVASIQDIYYYYG